MGSLDVILQQAEPEFEDPRTVFFDLILAAHELEHATRVIRKAWWPRITP
jgi:hypothetical protein